MQQVGASERRFVNMPYILTGKIRNFIRSYIDLVTGGRKIALFDFKYNYTEKFH